MTLMRDNLTSVLTAADETHIHALKSYKYNILSTKVLRLYTNLLLCCLCLVTYKIINIKQEILRIKVIDPGINLRYLF